MASAAAAAAVAVEPADNWGWDLDEELKSSQEEISLVDEACEVRTPSDTEDDQTEPEQLWWLESLRSTVSWLLAMT